MVSNSPGQPEHNTSLCLQGFGLAFGSRVILAECDLALAPTGIDVLMGPVKTGKSSLLRSLAGQFDGHAVHRSWGHASLRGRALQPEYRPQLVAQHVRSPARTVAAASPPWAPTPGISRGSVGAMARTRSISCG